MAFTRMSKKDRDFFKGMNLLGKKKAKSYSLVYSHGDNTETIIDQKTYALCKWKKNDIRHWNQYRDGNLNIVPNY